MSCGGDTYKHALECAMQTRRDLILGVAEDLGVTYVAYDRKEDEDLPRGEIQAALEAGELTQAEIVAAFAKGLREAL